MIAAYITLGVLVLLFGIYLFAIFGRPKKGRMEHLKKWVYAHRGLHGNGLPENSMAAFRAALEGGYGIELDIHLLKDGNLAVIHDSKLIRTTGCDGRIEDLTTDDLSNYRLEGTEETIPTFRQVVELFAGTWIRLFISEPATVEKGVAFLRVWFLCAPGMCFTNLFSSVFQSMGKWAHSLALSVIRQAGFLFPLLIVLNLVMGETGLVCAAPIADTCALLLGIFIYRRLVRNMNHA